MDLLLLFLLSPAVLVHGYGKGNDPNDQPFLPIYPVYPYSPKLIKRGAEKELVTQLASELYAPKVDSTDSYSASYSTNYPRDPYYTNYNPYNKVSHPSNYAYHSTLPYSYPTPAYTPYNSYSSPSYVMSPPSYAGIPYSSYPSHYYQPPYYYPSYYNQPPLAAPPLPSAAPDYPAGTYTEPESSDKFKEKSPDADNNYRDNDVSQFADGANHISEGSRDLDGQSSSYKASSLRNQLERSGEQRVKNLPIPLPKTTYRVISVAGQPVGPDYPLPAPYAKAQQLEELMSRAWARLLAQDLQQAAQYPLQEATSNDQNDQGKDKARAISVPGIAKTGLAYIVDPSVLRKFNAAPTVDQDLQVPGTTTQLKSIKYPHSTQPVYAIENEGKDQAEPNEYENYEQPSAQVSQDYDGPSNVATYGQVEKRRQNYGDDQGQAVSYRQQNYASVHASPGHSYRYTNYNPPQPTVQQQPQQYKNNLEDVDFGAKTKAG